MTEVGAFFSVWVIAELLGLAALPLVRRACAWLPPGGCGGYAFSKTAGLLLVSYLLWLGASAGLLTNTTGGILAALGGVLGVSAVVEVVSARGRPSPLRDFRRALSRRRERGFKGRLGWPGEAGGWHEVITVELLFLLAFAGWAVVRAFTPDKILFLSGEKFMEIGFLNGVLNSPHFPPLDPWLAGYGISYYYFGYVMMGLVTRLGGLAPTVGFELYDALLFGLTAITAYGVVSSLVRASGGAGRAARAYGLLGALLVGGLGSLEGVLEGLRAAGALPAAFLAWIDIPGLAQAAQTGSFYPGYDWWWWRASRSLTDLNLFNQPAAYQPITEFPLFSFLLGDNHPHKLALPFTLLAAGLALNLFLRQARPAGVCPLVGQPPARGWRRWLARITNRRETIGLGLFYAVVLGGLAFLNTWDFPIYLGLTGLAGLLGEYLRDGRVGPRHLARWAGLSVGLGLAAAGLYLFFYLGFKSQAGGLLPYALPPTRLAQYLVIFGPLIYLVGGFCWRASAAERLPWRGVGRAWLWITGLAFGPWLLAVLLGVALLDWPGSPLGAYRQSLLGDLSAWDGLMRIGLARLTQPGLYLLLSGLLALAVTTLLKQPAPAVQEVPAAQEVPMAQEVPAAEILPAAQILPAAGRFALLLGGVGLALTLGVEFFYLRDNFGDRMNTVFKFYYQAWVMLALAGAYGAWWVGRSARRGTRIFQIGAALLIAAGLVYPLMGIYSRAGEFRYPPTLDGAATLAGRYPASISAAWAAYPDDWAAIAWLRANGPGPDGRPPVILEAGAGGYEVAGRISAFTGFPTLLGWTNHEGQWRGTQRQINERTPVIQTLYTTPDAALALRTLRAWGVRYVIVGSAERTYVEGLCQQPARACSAPQALAKFGEVLTVVFQQGSITVYAVPGE